MLISEKNLIFPILYLYWLRSIAVAIHISKNEDRERISYIMDSDSVIAVPGIFTTYAVIEYGFTSGKTENEK